MLLLLVLGRALRFQPECWRGESGWPDVNISEQSVIVAARDQVSCDLGGEAAILNIKNGVYYGLDPVGAHVWCLLQKPVRIAEIKDAVLQAYDVDPERCRLDVETLLQDLLAEGLIEVRDGARG
jgi:hypothetical protein